MILTPGDLDFYLSRRTRFFRGPQRTALIARDRYCQDPGCGTPANKCEADHIQEYADGGLTLPDNGKMRCGPCHRHKTWLQARGLWTDPDKPDKDKPDKGKRCRDPQQPDSSKRNDPLNLFDEPFGPAKSFDPRDSDQLNLIGLTNEPVEAV